jgi:hypothetical protein
VNVNSLIIAYCEIIINRGVIIFADFVVCVRWYHTLQLIMHRIPMSMFNKGGIVLIVVNKCHDNQLPRSRYI